MYHRIPENEEWSPEKAESSAGCTASSISAAPGTGAGTGPRPREWPPAIAPARWARTAGRYSRRPAKDGGCPAEAPSATKGWASWGEPSRWCVLRRTRQVPLSGPAPQGFGARLSAETTPATRPAATGASEECIEIFVYLVRRRLKNVGSTLRLSAVRGFGYRLEVDGC